MTLKPSSFYFRWLQISICLCWASTVVFAQDSWVLDSIILEGNKVTKRSTVLRELDFQEGDIMSIAGLKEKLLQNERQLLNTNLFITARIDTILLGVAGHFCIRVSLKEDWYIYPVPQIELADRNFNVWWNEMGRKFNRLNLGLYLSWYNFSGRGDNLKVTVQGGYTQKYEVLYKRPYFDKKQRWGFALNALYSENKEQSFISRDNKLLFYRNFESDASVSQRLRFGAELLHRKGIFDQQVFGIYYQNLGISDSLAHLNPQYFSDGSTKLRSFNAYLKTSYDRRDLKAYPTKGWYLSGALQGTILDAQLIYFQAEAQYYRPLTKRIFVGVGIEGKTNLFSGAQPYYYQQALGFADNFVRGYQYYVIEGQHWALFRTDIGFRLLERTFRFGKLMPIPNFRQWPYKVYVRAHADAGYVADNQFNIRNYNRLANSLLAGAGVSLDILMLQNVLFQLDYSINLRAEHDFYLNYRLKF